ncbi:hypothetical protein [Kocuria rosea]|uniref:hypothetical protein n=1 Tax=Kocuria rosea TaxID=1275 RepID=UPI000F71F8AA|nr:hypothetical protein [Kocuria rosea]VEI50781.1 Uncharacterised protein [Kocuria rosea]
MRTREKNSMKKIAGSIMSSSVPPRKTSSRASSPRTATSPTAHTMPNTMASTP